jgi:diacylglycerol kinase (ATP)
MSRLAHSFKFAIKGMFHYFTSGGNVNIHLFASAAVIALGFWLEVSLNQWAILFLSIGMVHAAESFNTALEEIVNFISPQQHPSAGKIKDLAAGAVLISSITAAIIGIIIFAPILFEKFNLD